MKKSKSKLKLYIDSSSADHVEVRIGDKRYSAPARRDKSQLLLPFIVKVLEENKLDFKDIGEIEVNTGPGSFTGLRIGMSVALAIGWVLGVPVNGKKAGGGKALELKYEEACQ